MTKKSAKKSLAMSILSMALCLAMLIGSTYAWFSDEAKTDAVTITAGNLDVAIVPGSTQSDGLADAEDVTDLFAGLEEKGVDMENWEPGMMVTSDEFKIANKGTLALQYKINVEAKMADGAEHDLFDRIKYKVVEKTDEVQLPGEGSDLQARLTFWNSIEGDTDKTTGTITATQKVSGENPLVIVLFWEPDPSTADENADNTYNVKKDYESKKLTATFTVNVFATQTPEESDSFGNQYDSRVTDKKTPTTAEDLNDIFSKPNKNGVWNEVDLSQDMEMGQGAVSVSGDVVLNLGDNHLVSQKKDSSPGRLFDTPIEGLNITNGGNLVINADTKAMYDSNVATSEGLSASNSSQLEVNGGYYSYSKREMKELVSADSNSKVKINNGYYCYGCSTGTFIKATSGSTITISGGTFEFITACKPFYADGGDIVIDDAIIIKTPVKAIVGGGVLNTAAGNKWFQARNGGTITITKKALEETQIYHTSNAQAPENEKLGNEKWKSLLYDSNTCEMITNSDGSITIKARQ